jgi:hypothetical protein
MISTKEKDGKKKRKGRVFQKHFTSYKCLYLYEVHFGTVTYKTPDGSDKHQVPEKKKK